MIAWKFLLMFIRLQTDLATPSWNYPKKLEFACGLTGFFGIMKLASISISAKGF